MITPRSSDENPFFATKAPSHGGKDLISFSSCGALRLRVLVAGLVGRVSSVVFRKNLEEAHTKSERSKDRST